MKSQLRLQLLHFSLENWVGTILNTLRTKTINSYLIAMNSFVSISEISEKSNKKQKSTKINSKKINKSLTETFQTCSSLPKIENIIDSLTVKHTLFSITVIRMKKIGTEAVLQVRHHLLHGNLARITSKKLLSKWWLCYLEYCVSLWLRYVQYYA